MCPERPGNEKENKSKNIRFKNMGVLKIGKTHSTVLLLKMERPSARLQAFVSAIKHLRKK